MNFKTMSCLILSICLACLSCHQNESIKDNPEKSDQKDLNLIVEKPIKPKYATTHNYGGHSCPDNLRGFPPVNIKDLDKITAFNDLPPADPDMRKDKSLLFIDSTQIHTTKLADIELPSLARYYSDYTKKNELVVVIQAIIADKDTVVAFRYLNGGNGSSWMGEVEFLTDEEVKEIGETPFVFYKSKIDASSVNVWDVITTSEYATELREGFNDNLYIDTDWTANSQLHYKDTSGNIIKSGLITALWFNLYIQVDYNLDGQHYAEKFLILDDNLSDSTYLFVVSGPHGDDFEDKNLAWGKWLDKVKEKSEIIQ